MKITPAHDANDYAVWQRHPEIGLINILTIDGTLNESVPEKYRGLKMHTKAREAVVADMEAAGLFDPETIAKTARSTWRIRTAARRRSSRIWPTSGL